jgi:tetratricopeptide (TPR) repeat protein
MRRLSMMSLRKRSTTWLAVLLLIVTVASAQPANQNQSATNTTTEQLKTAVASEIQNGQNDKAIADIQRVLLLEPDWKQGWWTLATLQYETNQYAQASQAFAKVTTYAPEAGPVWAMLGLSEFELKQYPEALSHLEKAQSLGFGSDVDTARVAKYHLALLLIRNGQFERGSTLLHSTFEEGAASPQVQLALGLALLRVPLLPDELDPSKEALVRAAGSLASGSTNSLQQFPEFIAAHPTTPFVHYAYGIRLKAAARWSDALAQQRKEAAISPRSPLPWLEIRDLQTKLNRKAEAAVAEHKAQMLESARQSSTSRDPEIIALYRSPGNPSGSPQVAASTTERTRAMDAYASGSYPEAIAGLKRWLNANPSDGTGWAVLGLSEFALKDYDNAEIHLERGKRLGLSGSPQAIQQTQYTLGILLIRSGQFDEASQVLSSAAGNGSLAAQARFASGLALLRMRKLPDQVESSQRDLIDRAGQIAQLLFASRYDEAEPDFQALLRQYPQTPYLHYAYGTALLAISRYKDASAQMQDEIAISPQSELPYVRLASIALRQQQPAEAIAPAEKALRLNAKSAEAHYLLGRAVLETGNTVRAAHELEIACQLSPTSPEAHFNLAKAYSKSGQPQKAEQERARFLELSEIADTQKRAGSQIYRGPHDSADMSSQSTAAVPR